MTPQLFGHPFSSYTWKALIAFQQNDTPFEFRVLDQDHPENGRELARRWPLTKFPVLVHGERFVAEATIIIEYLALHFPGPVVLISDDKDGAIEARMLARPSDAGVVDQARPYRHLFPCGAPDRD